MGTELGNLCCLLCIFILHVSILTHAPPSPPLLTFGARHSHGCGRLYACSPPGGTQCPPFAVHVTVINTTTTTTVIVWIAQSNTCRALAGCVERTAGHASVWIATSFACSCSCTLSVRSTHPAASHHLSRVRQLSDSRCSATQRGSTAPGRHGHQTTPR